MDTPFNVDSPLPVGTVTFLFTDIEDSTALWDRYPQAMQAALARHDTLLHGAIASANGRIVKTTGDGVYAVFAAAADALAACLAAQRALQRQADGESHANTATSAPLPGALRVRMGLHTGVAESRGDDYFGAAVNRAARIMSVAHGEQVLLSATSADALSGGLPEGITLRDVGEHRLKGLAQPERLLQVVAAGLRDDFPPLASLTGHRLPAERDAFVGRSDALLELTRRMRGRARLVSVIGIGGIGKTRLITRFGWESLGAFPGGVWFCDLSQARSLDGVLYAAAHGLDLPLGKDDPVTQIGNAIAGRGRCLVILDNFEQVARFAEETLGSWLSRAPEARFIATTREVLGLPGEEVLVLAPLAASDAATLFLRRAEAAQPGFRATAEDQSVIVTLMKLLEGMPLAIELAAARLRVMSPKSLLARMNERFKLLTSTGGRVDRQATLRAVFDWSWDLLSAPEKAALAQLSVFEGGFTLEAVEAVLDVSATGDAPYPVDLIQSLLQKSFVRQSSDERFDLLVSVQEYASMHLRTAGSYPGSGSAALRSVEERHGSYFANLDEPSPTASASAELDNVVAACRRAVARTDVRIAARTLEGAWERLHVCGPYRPGVELAALVQAIPGLEGTAMASVCCVLGNALAITGRYAEAQAQYDRAASVARESGDRHCECRALIGLGFLDLNLDRHAPAAEHLDAALVLARELGERKLQADAHNGLGNLYQRLGRVNEARGQFEQSLLAARDVRDRQRECAALGNLGSLHTDCGNMAESRAHQEASLAVARETGNRRIEGNVLCNLGLLHYVEASYDDALDRLEAALALGRDLGNRRLEAIVSCNLAMVCDRLGRFDEAHACFEAALSIVRAFADSRSEGQFLSYFGLLHAHRANFDEARRCFSASEALLRATADPVSLGILFCNRAEAEVLAETRDAACAALAEAEAIGAEAGARPTSELGVALARVRELVAR